MWHIQRTTGEWIEAEALPAPEGFSKAILMDGIKEVVRLHTVNIGETVWVAVI